MKYIKFICLAAILFTVCSAFEFPFPFLKKQGNIVYAYGVSASFKDSIIYFTEIQTMDSVKLKNGMLPNRYEYSQELKIYMEDKMKLANQTCVIYFGKDKEQLEKKKMKLRSKYLKDKKVSLKIISAADFKFTKPADSEVVTQ